MIKSLLFLLFSQISAVFYLLPPEKETCFLLDLPDSIVIFATYGLFNRPPEDMPEDGVLLRVLNTRSSQIFQQVFRETGKFSFTSQESGKHRVCIQTTRRWTNEKVGVEIKLDNYQNYEVHEHLVKKDELLHIDEIVQSLNQRTEDLIKVQQYDREKEAKFKDESEEVHGRILVFTLVQTLVIFFSGVWQILNLRRFFIEKRIF
jgi:hypothetical protein